MTDTDPNLPTGTDDFLDRYRGCHERAVALRAANKVRLLAALSEAGISSVEVRFDGYGDSGQIEDVTAFAGDAVAELPVIHVEMLRMDYLAEEPVGTFQLLADAIETLCYALLEGSYCGWENNGGAFGDFTFDVPAGTITLDYNQRIETSENFEHIF